MSTLTAYQPFRHNPVISNSWFNSVFQDWYYSSADVSAKELYIDVREDDNCYYVEAELPGVTEKDANITIDHNLLTITAEISRVDKHKESSYMIRERRFGTFKRSFVLPKDVVAEEINASYRNGLLVITVPKSASAQPTQIPIETA